jgi:hypothetical protein
MGGESRLLQRVGKGIVSDIVKQGGQPYRETAFFRDRVQLAPLLQRRQRQLGQMIGTKGVLESGMGGTGIDQEGVTQLANIAEALDRRRIDQPHNTAIHPDVIPEWIADNLKVERTPGH